MPAAEEEGKTGNGNDRMSSAKNLDSFKMDDRFADGGLRRAKLASDDGYGSPGYGSMEGEIIPDSGTQGIPWFLGALIFVNALVGAGILNFPYSIHAAGGIYVAMTVQLVMVSLLWSSVTSVIWCSHLRGTTLYQDTVHAYLGSFGQYLCSAIMLIYLFLMTTTYVIAIGEQISAGARIIFPELDKHPLLSKEFLVIGVSLAIILPFCLVKHIDRLHAASAFASLAVVLVAGVVVYEYHHRDTSHVHIRTSPTNWRNVFLSVPAYAIAYMFDLASVAVYGRMEPRTVGSFVKASIFAIVSVFCFYNIFAGHAYYTFGDKIQPNFMTNYDDGTWVVASAQLVYSLKLCLEYPIYQFLGWTALRTLLSGIFGDYCMWYMKESSDAEGTDRFRLMTSLLWIFSTTSLAFFAPNINSVIPLASATVLHFQFTFPGMMLLAAISEYRETLSAGRAFGLRLFGIFLVIFGISLSAVLLYQYQYGLPGAKPI